MIYVILINALVLNHFLYKYMFLHFNKSVLNWIFVSFSVVATKLFHSPLSSSP